MQKAVKISQSSLIFAARCCHHLTPIGSETARCSLGASCEHLMLSPELNPAFKHLSCIAPGKDSQIMSTPCSH